MEYNYSFNFTYILVVSTLRSSAERGREILIIFFFFFCRLLLLLLPTRHCHMPQVVMSEVRWQSLRQLLTSLQQKSFDPLSLTGTLTNMEDMEETKKRVTLEVSSLPPPPFPPPPPPPLSPPHNLPRPRHLVSYFARSSPSQT